MKLANDSVNIQGLQVQMKPVLQIAKDVWWDEIKVVLTITAGLDGIHSAGSYHYYGFAVDLRTWGEDGNQVSDEVRKRLASILASHLKHFSPYFDVIVHSTHIHVEFDAMRAGIVF